MPQSTQAFPNLERQAEIRNAIPFRFRGRHVGKLQPIVGYFKQRHAFTIVAEAVIVWRPWRAAGLASGKEAARLRPHEDVQPSLAGVRCKSAGAPKLLVIHIAAPRDFSVT